MYLGIDAGTGTLKAAIFSSDGALVSDAEEAYDAPVLTSTGADFDPEVWWHVCRRVVRRAAQPHGRAVTAVGVAGQMHGVVVIDARNRPVRPAVLWPDQRAVVEAGAFADFDEAHPGVLGNPVVPGMAGPILSWLARHEPEALRKADRVVQPKDWLRAQLCGGADAITDPSDASATLLYDVSADDWSDAVCEAVGVSRRLLPPIHASSSVAGPLEPTVAEDLHLPAGVPVVVGAGDAAAALLGAGIEEPGSALINIGSGGQAMTPIPAPTAGQRLGPGIHQYRSASETTRWYGMAAVANAGLALEWVRGIVGYDWDQMYATTDTVLTAHATDPLFLPFLSSERMPSSKPLVGGSWSGLTLAHDRDALARSALRGIAFYLGIRAKALMHVTDAATAVLSGGGVRHTPWVEVMATILGREVTVAKDAHLTVRGAARIAARGVGSDLPDPVGGERVEPRPGVDLTEPMRAFERAAMHHFGAYA